MQHILVYADSLSWGIIPATRQRLPFDQRWPGVMEIELIASGKRSESLKIASMADARFGMIRSNPAEMVWSGWLNALKSIRHWRWLSCCSAPTISNLCTSTTLGILPKALPPLFQLSVPRRLNQACQFQPFWLSLLRLLVHPKGRLLPSSRVGQGSVSVWRLLTSKSAKNWGAISSIQVQSSHQAMLMGSILMRSST